jgi:flagellar protein FliS
MPFDASNPYFRTKVLTASPEELRLMLIEGAVRFLAEGRDALEVKQFEAMHTALTSARNIIIELTSSLRRDVDPDLCARLDAIYTYVLRLTIEGSFHKNAARLNEAISLMEYDRETWSLLMDKIAAERAPGTPPGTPPGPAPDRRVPLSVQG